MDNPVSNISKKNTASSTAYLKTNYSFNRYKESFTLNVKMDKKLRNLINLLLIEETDTFLWLDEPHTRFKILNIFYNNLSFARDRFFMDFSNMFYFFFCNKKELEFNIIFDMDISRDLDVMIERFINAILDSIKTININNETIYNIKIDTIGEEALNV